MAAAAPSSPAGGANGGGAPRRREPHHIGPPLVTPGAHAHVNAQGPIASPAHPVMHSPIASPAVAPPVHVPRAAADMRARLYAHLQVAPHASGQPAGGGMGGPSGARSASFGGYSRGGGGPGTHAEHMRASIDGGDVRHRRPSSPTDERMAAALDEIESAVMSALQAAGPAAAAGAAAAGVAGPEPGARGLPWPPRTRAPPVVVAPSARPRKTDGDYRRELFRRLQLPSPAARPGGAGSAPPREPPGGAAGVESLLASAPRRRGDGGAAGGAVDVPPSPPGSAPGAEEAAAGRAGRSGSTSSAGGSDSGGEREAAGDGRVPQPSLADSIAAEVAAAAVAAAATPPDVSRAAGPGAGTAAVAATTARPAAAAAGSGAKGERSAREAAAAEANAILASVLAPHGVEPPRDGIGGEGAGSAAASTARRGPVVQPGVPVVVPLGRDDAGWVPSAGLSNCQRCGVKFGLIQRKHHCRACGALLCAACSPYRTTALPRVCYSCHALQVRPGANARAPV